MENTITFADKSRLGKGGMTAKVKVAVYASQADIPIVITSGFAGDNIIKVIRGQNIGMLFHREAHTFIPSGELNAREMVVAARESSRLLQVSCFEFLTSLLMGLGQNSSTLVHRCIFVLCIDSFDFRTEKDYCVLAKTDRWYRRVVEYWKQMRSVIQKDSVINSMDMNSNLGGFATALKDKDVWVINVAPVNASSKLKIIKF